MGGAALPLERHFRMGVDHTDRAAFAERVKICAKRVGSLSRLATVTGYTLYKLRGFSEGSGGQPTREELKRIAHAAHVRSGWLVDGELPMTHQPSIDPLKDDEVYLRVEQQREVPGGALIRSLVVARRWLDDRAPEKAVRAMQAYETVPNIIAPSDVLLIEILEVVNITGVYLLHDAVMPLLRRFIVDRVLGTTTMLGPSGNREMGIDEMARVKVLGRVFDVVRPAQVSGQVS